jgi:hypothetical protein
MAKKFRELCIINQLLVIGEDCCLAEEVAV